MPDYPLIVRNASFLFDGLLLSLTLTLAGVIGGLAVGTALALVRLFTGVIGNRVVDAYVFVFRAIPLILVIFWFYFMVPLVVGRPVGAWTSAIVAFTLFEGAYYSEILRLGILVARPGELVGCQSVMGRGRQLSTHEVGIEFEELPIRNPPGAVMELEYLIDLLAKRVPFSGSMLLAAISIVSKTNGPRPSRTRRYNAAWYSVLVEWGDTGRWSHPCSMSNSRSVSSRTDEFEIQLSLGSRRIPRDALLADSHAHNLRRAASGISTTSTLFSIARK
jgi:His/Glu/Gln/Arg/opine family amino acid ABC transporter permease subunit